MRMIRCFLVTVSHQLSIHRGFIYSNCFPVAGCCVYQEEGVERERRVCMLKML
jgi:hypothetical protein